MHRIHRDRKQRPLLPLKNMAFILIFEPDFRRTATLYDKVNFLVHMFFGMQRAGTRNFHNIAAPFSFSAVKLNIRAAPAHALPWRQRKVPNVVDSNIPEYRNTFAFHELVIGRRDAFEISKASSGFFTRWLVPMLLSDCVMRHCLPPRSPV